MINREDWDPIKEWDDYLDYLEELSDEELQIEIQWIESVGKAKARGSMLSSFENYTIQ